MTRRKVTVWESAKIIVSGKSTMRRMPAVASNNATRITNHMAEKASAPTPARIWRLSRKPIPYRPMSPNTNSTASCRRARRDNLRCGCFATEAGERGRESFWPVTTFSFIPFNTASLFDLRLNSLLLCHIHGLVVSIGAAISRLLWLIHVQTTGNSLIYGIDTLSWQQITGFVNMP